MSLSTTLIGETMSMSELEEKARYLEILNDFAFSMMRQHTETDILWDVTSSVISLLGFYDCIIYLFDESGDVLIQRAALGPKNPTERLIKNPIKIKKGSGVVGTVAVTGIAEKIDDTSLDSRYILDDEMRYSEIAVPIKIEDEIIGVIDSEHPEKAFFNHMHMYVLKKVAFIMGDKIKVARSQNELAQYRLNLEAKVRERTEELYLLMEELKESNTDLMRFAYASSHDLKEPLRMISSYLQLIKYREKNLQKESIDNIDFVVKSAKRMGKILDGLLAYSKLNLKNIEKSSVDLNQILEVVLGNLSLLIESTNTKISFLSDMPMIEGHEILLTQLFQNLISNSIKFRKKGVSPEIKLSYEYKNDQHYFSIEDNGIGIEEEFKDDVFNLFNRLSKSEDIQGSGIGLALCKNIVNKHKGEIWFEDNASNGATVIFTLRA